MKLLYAEDEPALSEAVVDYLTYHKYIVDAVYDGADAYDLRCRKASIHRGCKVASAACSPFSLLTKQEQRLPILRVIPIRQTIAIALPVTICRCPVTTGVQA